MPVALPFDRFSAYSPLFKHYTGAFDGLDPFFPADWKYPAAQAQAVVAAVAVTRQRDAVANVLLDQNRQWGEDPLATENIEALRRPDTAAVVTGQQMGLYAGPLYTLLKTITTIQLAERLSRETGHRVVPVFWLEGEDHDFDEVSAITLLRGLDPVDVRYTPSKPHAGKPVGTLLFDPTIEEANDRLEKDLPDSEFKALVVSTVREMYRPGVSFLDAFAGLMRRFFPDSGLVFVNPGDRRLKALAAPLFRKEIERPGALFDAVEGASKRLESQFHLQVRPRPVNLFLVRDGVRRALSLDGSRFVLQGTETSWTRDELLNLLDTEPEAFSPNVVMRPLMQDTLFPTAAYVAGPGEVAYFAQFRDAYRWAGLPMPLIYPRACATLVEGRVRKTLSRQQLDVPDFDMDIEPLFAGVLARGEGRSLDEAFHRASAEITNVFEALKPQVTSLDATLAGTLEAARTAAGKELDRLKDRVVKAEKRKNDELRMQLVRAQSALFPQGKLQERCLSPLHFFARYGPYLMKRLFDEIDLDTTAHQVIDLQG